MGRMSLALPPRLPLAPLVFALLLAAGCRAAPGRAAPELPLAEAPAGSPERTRVEAVLDAWYDAAARADEERYLGLMAPGAVFVGTDAGERWAKDEFRAFVEPYFAKGRGWRYEPRERHVFVAGDVAWADEKLWNESYGATRGTTVLVRSGPRDGSDGEWGGWRIAHHTLSFAVPNELAPEIVRRIRGGE